MSVSVKQKCFCILMPYAVVVYLVLNVDTLTSDYISIIESKFLEGAYCW